MHTLNGRMAGMESGVYLTFYNEDESREKELPALGPFETLVIRHNRILGSREDIEHDEAATGSVERWLEAELELRRALGEEPGGIQRSHMRIRAPHGDILVRFFDYSGDQPPELPELGPFYSLSVGKRDVRGDDKLLATRMSDIAPWTLTDAIRPGIAGVLKTDFAVFTKSAREVAPVGAIAPAAASAAADPVPEIEFAPEPAEETAPRDFVERKAKTQEIYVSRPIGGAPTAPLTPEDGALLDRVEKLREAELMQALMVERMRRDQHVDPEDALRADAVASSTRAMRFQPPVDERPEVDEDDDVEYEPLSFAERVTELLWSGRIVIVAVLVLAAAVAAYGYVRQGPANAAPATLTIVALGTKMNTPDWTVAVDSVERARTIGATAARQGGYLVVHVTATKRNGDAPNLDPADFVLVDTAGNQSLAFSPTSDVYGPSTGLSWPARFAVGAPVREQLVFDVSPNARDLLLLFRKATTEVRLPN